MNSQHPSNEPVGHRLTPSAEAEAQTEEAKRIAARRRFLRMGAGGSAVLVTIVHKRAFAQGMSIKQGAIASACVSMMGVPDIKQITQKNALQLSAMGNPKNMMCNARGTTNTCITPDGNSSKYLDASGQPVSYFKENQLNKGCGDLTDTVHDSYNFRLYEKGYCPVVFDASGNLTYDLSAKYYTFDHNVLVTNACQGP